MKCPSDVGILYTRLSLNMKHQHKGAYEGLGILVLLMAIKGTKLPLKIQNYRVKWAIIIIEMCQYCRVNILNSNMVSHHKSHCDINSFGYQGLT